MRTSTSALVRACSPLSRAWRESRAAPSNSSPTSRRLGEQPLRLASAPCPAPDASYGGGYDDARVVLVVLHPALHPRRAPARPGDLRPPLAHPGGPVSAAGHHASGEGAALPPPDGAGDEGGDRAAEPRSGERDQEA